MELRDLISRETRITAVDDPFTDTVFLIQGSQVKRTRGQTYREAVHVEVITEDQSQNDAADRAIEVLEYALKEMRAANRPIE